MCWEEDNKQDLKFRARGSRDTGKTSKRDINHIDYYSSTQRDNCFSILLDINLYKETDQDIVTSSSILGVREIDAPDAPTCPK